jgi:hypothetical protein
MPQGLALWRAFGLLIGGWFICVSILVLVAICAGMSGGMFVNEVQ